MQKKVVWFMAYQPLWFIQRQIHPSRRTVGVLFNPLLRDKEVHTFPKFESEHYGETGIRTRWLLYRSPARGASPSLPFCASAYIKHLTLSQRCLAWWSDRRETDSHQVPLILCLQYPNLDLYLSQTLNTLYSII